MAITRGKKSLQRQAPRATGWTLQRRKTFLDELAASCNVTRAARAAGMTPQAARLLKARDGEFAALWDAAFHLGAERLEEDLVAHALGAPTGDNPTAAREELPSAPFDPSLALKVLRWRAGFSTSGRRTGRPTFLTQAEVDAALLARLDELAKRLPSA